MAFNRKRERQIVKESALLIALSGLTIDLIRLSPLSGDEIVDPGIVSHSLARCIATTKPREQWRREKCGNHPHQSKRAEQRRGNCLGCQAHLREDETDLATDNHRATH